MNVYPQDKNIVYLFDNSGSMSGYYREQTSVFRIFSKALIKNTVKGNDNVNIMIFTKSDSKRGITSPKSLFKGNSKGLILEKVMADFNIIKAADGGFGTTDLIEALDKSIENFGKNTGVIWLVTDNINDNSGSGDSSYFNTLEFYKRLRTDDKIKKVLLYPIPEKVTEAGYESKGYIVYGIVYSEKGIAQPELEYYDKYFRSSGIKQKAITLKPMDIGTIILSPKTVQGKISPAKLFFDGKTLRGYDFEEGQNIKEVFNDLTLKSNLYPYIIKSAKLGVKLDDFTSTDYSVKSLGTQTITPSTVSNVSPEGEVTGFSITFIMPEITPKFSFNTIFKNDFAIGGNLVLEVSQVDILLDEGYMNNFKELFALQTVPEVFKPMLKDKKIITNIPLEIRMKYGPWRLFVLIGLLVIAAGITGFVLFLFFRKKCYLISINNSESQNICLSSIGAYPVSYGYSAELGRIKKLLSGSLKFSYSKFTTSPGITVNLIEGIPLNIEYEESEYKKTSVTIMLVSSVTEEKESASEEFGKFH